jgi:hypothetical protein
MRSNFLMTSGLKISVSGSFMTVPSSHRELGDYLKREAVSSGNVTAARTPANPVRNSFKPNWWIDNLQAEFADLDLQNLSTQLGFFRSSIN